MNTINKFWQKEKLAFSRNIVLVILAAAVEFFAWGIGETFFSIMVESIVDNLFIVGLLWAFFNFTLISSIFFIPFLLKRFSARRLLITSKILNMTAMFLYFVGGIQKNLLLFFLACFINGIGAALRDVSDRDFLLENSEKARMTTVLGSNFAIQDTLRSMGILLSGLIIFVFTSNFNIIMPEVIPYNYLLASPILGLSLIFLLKIKEPTTKSKSKKELYHKNAHPRLFIKAFFLLSKEGKFSLLLISFLEMIFISILIFLPLLINSLGLSFFYIALFAAFLNFSLILASFFSVLEDYFDKMTFIILGLLLSSLPLFFLTITDIPAIIAFLLFLISLSICIIKPASLSMIANNLPRDEMPNLASLQIFAKNIGAILAALILGAVAEKYGINLVFIITAMIAIFFAVLAIVLKWHLGKKFIAKEKFFISHFYIIPHHHH